MPAMSNEAEERPRRSICRWFRCQCQKLRVVNDRLFIAAPMVAMGSSLSELVVVFTITGFTNLDMVAVSSVSLCLLLAFAVLLFIRFDRLTLLAYLMVCVSFLSSSTFLVISIENLNPNVNESSISNTFLVSSSSSSGSHPGDGGEPIDLVIGGESNGSRHGRKLFELMKSESELRWIHQIQSNNRCCGYWNYSDWIEPARLQDTNKTYFYIATEPISPPPKWVTSCCDRTLNRDNNKCRSDSVYDDWKDAVQYLFTEGCGSLLDDELDKVQQNMVKTSTALLFWDICILVDIVVYSIWRKFRSRSSDCQRNGGIRDCGAEEDDVFT